MSPAFPRAGPAHAGRDLTRPLVVDNSGGMMSPSQFSVIAALVGLCGAFPCLGLAAVQVGLERRREPLRARVSPR